MKLLRFKQSELTGILYFMLRPLQTSKPRSVVALGYNGNKDHLAQFHRQARLRKRTAETHFISSSKQMCFGFRIFLAREEYLMLHRKVCYFVFFYGKGGV